MIRFQTCADNLAELDLCLLETHELTGSPFVAYARNLVVEIDGAEPSAIERLKKRSAYLWSTVSFDGSPEERTEWNRLRHLVPVGLRDHSTHNLVPFEGKMLPQLARCLINICCGQKGKCLVLDPCCGSGTVPLEAILMGHDAIARDADPVAVQITKAKVCNDSLRFSEFVANFLNARLSVPNEIFTARSLCPPPSNVCTPATGDARHIYPADIGFVDAVVTSPPYFNAIDYTERYRGADEVELMIQQIGARETVEEYERSIGAVCIGIANVLVEGGRCALVLGETMGVPTVEWYEMNLKLRGLSIIAKIDRPYQMAKRGFDRDVILIAEKSHD